MSFALVIFYQIVWCVAESIAVSTYRGTSWTLPKEAAKSPWLPFAAAVTAVMLAISVAFFAWRESPSFPAIAIPLGVIGIVFRVLAIRELGPLFRDFIDLAPNHPRIKTGPYRFLKHPGDIGFLLAMAGLVFLAPTAITGTLFVALLGFSIYRMRLENELLSA